MFYLQVVLVEFEDDVAQRIDRTRVAPEIDSFLFNELTPNTDYEVGVIAYVDHEPRRVYRLVFSTADLPTTQLEDSPIIVGEKSENYAVHWKAPVNGLDVERFVVEYKPDNATRWERVGADSEVVSGQESYSIDAAELSHGFTIRVIMVGDEDRAVAKTREALVQNQNSQACSSLAGVPTEVKAKTSLDKLTFTWNVPTCEDSNSNVVGYEYAVIIF